eukprot:CAMPEP_0170539984 /NCGR_PEP_ID=MMETSP0209-20121228/104358_1 /TAXON_ID=665100 ORGANISM="Litonotus pictus, Strain P1" /NCGR_SAMPLE_ID=MMETSP0209 /ASSEMBLY_ACC=CAM_ASM_000301 /LENGTH=180 /DNA_ID=CAMNT_0010842221 /DNA_START=492 /DNA_END=1031 /DNA_ORIENTATION=-
MTAEELLIETQMGLGLGETKDYDEENQQCCLTFKLKDPGESLISEQTVFVCSMKKTKVECSLEIHYIQAKISENCNAKYMREASTTIEKSLGNNEIDLKQELISGVGDVPGIGYIFSSSYVMSRITDVLISKVRNVTLREIKKSEEIVSKDGSSGSYDKLYDDTKSKRTVYLNSLAEAVY